MTCAICDHELSDCLACEAQINAACENCHKITELRNENKRQGEHIQKMINDLDKILKGVD